MEDIIQLIIVLLVIAGSLLGPIVKKLIETFSPKEEDTPATVAKRIHTDSSQDQAAAPAHPRPPRPVARRIMQSPRPVVQEETTEVVPIPRPPQRYQTTIKQTQRRETPPAPPIPRRRRSATIPEDRSTVAAPSIENIEDPLGHLISMVEQTGGADEMAAEDRLGHVESVVDDAGEQLHDSVDEHLGHVEPTDYTRSSSVPGRAEIPGFGLATPRSLRQAVLLREILGPPVALRQFDDTSRWT